MPDQPEHYRKKPTESESRFTVEPSQDIPIKQFSGPPAALSGIATILAGYGAIGTPQISESVMVDKDKVASLTGTISESVEVTVS